jgi:DNA replication protein DnaC
LKLSKLRYAGSLEEISYSPSRNMAKEQIVQLADCSYIDRSENILISGATGAGKSFLACALGHQACAMGYKTLYLNLNRFTEKIMVAKLDGSFVKLLNQLDKVSLLILDDFGLAPMDQNTRLALLQILEDRYNKKSVVIASQLPINKWHEYIAEPTLADAIMDRLMANAHRFELKGESLRKKSIKNPPEKR